MPREEKGTTTSKPKGLRSREEIIAANEDIYLGSFDGRYHPKQVEQANAVIKAQIKILYEIPFKALQLLRDLRKSGLDTEGTDSRGSKLLDANPALKELIGG